MANLGDDLKDYAHKVLTGEKPVATVETGVTFDTKSASKILVMAVVAVVVIIIIWRFTSKKK